MQTLLNNICRNLNLNDLVILLSSEIDKQIVKDELKVKTNIPELTTNQYFFCELADMEFFRRVHNVTTKISWIIPGVESNGHDERFFDSHFSKIWNQHLNFIHIGPGFTFNKDNWRSSPYIHKVGQNRILLESDEDVKAKLLKAESEWNDKNIGGAKNHLKKVIRVFESLFGNLGKFSLEEKIELIINKSISEN